MKALKTLATTAVALTMMAGAACAQAAGEEINFGIISTEASTNLKKIWDPFLEDMAKATGHKINGFYASDYAGVIEAMRFKKVHIAWFGNKSAMEAVNRANGEIFAQSVDGDGNPGYWSHLIVHKDSPIKSLDDVLKCDKSLDFGNGDPNSTSGFLVPTSYIFAAKNIDPKQCFKTVRGASHEANGMAVANKQVSVATNNSENLRRLEKTAPDAAKNIRVIWTSPLIPSDPLVWRKDISADVKTKLYTFIMSYGRVGAPDEVAAAKAKLAGLQWAPFNPSNDDQLLPIRTLEANKSMLKVKSDDKLSAEEKQKQIAALQAEIKSYEDKAAKADKSSFSTFRTTFIEADKAKKSDVLKKMIADMASKLATAATN
ncbi:phosphonate ABC transporter substrate-binding protein [Xanthobacteraceae bacterium Astr-EGSB]|uniref:phosphonate ABC transporter substrate-binding protein n=1 Tax=Astrobacterium formosum TaxID=3069710 RepID=UPI0027B45649|nr:phosphonate ABC transporter substrate-binding protein [Xanthobacteraceae bacterium Astr-EGSB]